MNYMLRIDGEPAAMGSLFLNGGEGYLANDYTFPDYRGKGCQLSLLKHQLAEAVRRFTQMWSSARSATRIWNGPDSGLPFSTLIGWQNEI
ncbi:hypothetical protein D3C86_2009380 [compost metagenome]